MNANMNIKSETIEQTNAATLLVKVFFGKIGTNRKADKNQVTVAADPESFGFTKHLLKCSEFAAINSHDTATKKWLLDRSVPSLFAKGIYVIRPELADDVDSYLNERKNERAELIDALLAAYDDQINADRIKLDSLFKVDDYPAREIVAARFVVVWRFFSVGNPDALESVSPELFARERERIAAMVDETIDNARLILRQAFADLVSHLTDRLKDTDDDDGPKKRFHKSNLTKIEAFIETFNARDIANDDELKTLLSTTRALLSGVDAEGIRASVTVRENARTGFETIKESIDAMIDDAPKRFINVAAFADDE